MSPIFSESAGSEGTPGTSGRRKSQVWQYFEFDADEKKSSCTVKTDNQQICGKQIPGKFPTNLKNHLRIAHPEVYAALLEKEEAEKKTKAEKECERKAASLKVSHQLTLAESLKSGQTYEKSSRRQTEITKKLAIFVGSSNVAYSIVENLEFRDLLATLDNRYSTPSRTLIVKEVQKVLIELKARIGTFLHEARKISICADVWSKKGLTSSYLGITAHFFSRKDHRRHCVTLAVRRMVSAHTGAYIRKVVDEVLGEWEIHPTKVLASLTDNGSNMVAAFRVQLQVLQDDEDDEEDEEENMEEQELEEQESDFESIDFEDRECDQAIAFHSLGRISCFAHTLQLVVNKFSEITAFKGVLNRAHTLIRKVNSSGKATESLVLLSGKKLVRDCPTRWSSTYLMINRMLEVRNSLTSVLEELEWDNLAVSEWKLLEALRDLLHPFAIFTALVQGEEFTTLSCVVPAIMDLCLHLEEFKRNPEPEVCEAAALLLRELKRRFRKYTDPGDTDHESIFIVATSLDPRYRLLLSAAQLDCVKQELVKKLKEAAREKNDASSSSENELTSHDIIVQDCEEPPTKRFRHLNRILEEKWKEGLRKTSAIPLEKAEVERYFQTVESVVEKVDPITYWISHEKNYPLLSSVAVDILTIPASSAPIERVFSTAGESTAGKRNRLSDRNLECEILLRRNRHFL